MYEVDERFIQPREPREYEAAIEHRQRCEAFAVIVEREEARRAIARAAAATVAKGGEAGCPKCGGRMWDQRSYKRNPDAPDFKCRDTKCGGIVWPPRPRSTARELGTIAPAPHASSWFHTTDGRYFASDADRRAHQRTLDERAARMSRRAEAHEQRQRDNKRGAA